MRQESAEIVENIEANSIRQIKEANQRAQQEKDKAKAEIERIQNAKAAEINEMKVEANAKLSEVAKQTQQQKQELETALHDSKEEAEQALNTERERAARAIDHIKSEMNGRLEVSIGQAQEQITKLETELEQVKLDNAQTIAQMKQEHEVKVQKLKAHYHSYAQEMKTTLKSQEEALDEAKRHAASRFAEYEAKIEALRMQEKELSTSTRSLQENIKALEQERHNTYINYANIERESILACQEFASAIHRLTMYVLRTVRDATVHQSKRMYAMGSSFYADTARPPFDASVVAMKTLYSSHVQPSLDKLANSANAKYSNHVKPHIDAHVMPIYEGKVKPGFETYVVPVYTNHIVPAYNNHVIPAKNKALDAAVAGLNAALVNAESVRSSAWADIKDALVLAQDATKEACGYAATFISSCRAKVFDFAVRCTRKFFDGCLRFVENYDKNKFVSGEVKGHISRLRDNSETVVTTTKWMMLFCLIIIFLPFIFDTVAFVAEVAVVIAMELIVWPIRIVWFLCPLRFLFARREENMPDAVAVIQVASTEEASKSDDLNAPDLVDDTLNVDVRPITPPERKEMSTRKRPQTRSASGK